MPISVLLGVAGKGFTLYMFWVGGFADAALGIALQLILVPLIVTALRKFTNKE
jgi:hypothetical protein